jgi:hypothetical protein
MYICIILSQLASRAAGLKMYLGETFSNLHLKNIADWSKHFESWPETAPLCVHAEGNCVAAVVLLGLELFFCGFQKLPPYTLARYRVIRFGEFSPNG